MNDARNRMNDYRTKEKQLLRNLGAGQKELTGAADALAVAFEAVRIAVEQARAALAPQEELRLHELKKASVASAEAKQVCQEAERAYLDMEQQLEETREAGRLVRREKATTERALVVVKHDKTGRALVELSERLAKVRPPLAQREVEDIKKLLGTMTTMIEVNELVDEKTAAARQRARTALKRLDDTASAWLQASAKSRR
jgi:hypothetical protein